MQAAPEWPTLPGDGRVPLPVAQAAAGEAKVGWQKLLSMTAALQQYIRSVVLQEKED